ncbi:MAG TPA: hypothetical protein VMM18_02370 [Gemmatimonadaceae bacterium]|nr:hypothetical protein [Gemmatimonadaceae bacterium]
MSNIPSTLALALIRIVLLLGVLMFGALTMFVQGQDTWMPAPPETLERLRYVGVGVWAVAILMVLLLRTRGMPPEGRAGAATPSIIGWAIGEAVALFGGVYYFLSGSGEWYLLGVMFLAATFIVFPIPRSSGRPGP